jgi:hypothetical protein
MRQLKKVQVYIGRPCGRRVENVVKVIKSKLLQAFLRSHVHIVHPEAVDKLLSAPDVGMRVEEFG